MLSEDSPMDLLAAAESTLLTAGLPGIGGVIKQEPEDFEVEEIPAYEPSGSGEFLYLWVEKRDMGAEYFARQIAQRLGITVGEGGTAGLKDRRAVTRQMVSVPERCEDRLAQLEGDGIRVLRVSRHGNKLRPGHLHGNRFRILIRGVVSDATERLGPIVDQLRKEGIPNFYGPQRFGRDGETLRLGLEMMQGAEGGSRPRRVNPFLRKLALSAVQSALFNRYLSQRLRDGLLRSVLPGDVMAKWPFGGMFVAEDVAREQSRFDLRETVSAGPMFGHKLFRAHAQAADREAAILKESGFALDNFRSYGKLLSGTRRHNLVYADDLSAVVESEGVQLLFTLPAGSYATVLLCEFIKENALDVEEASL